MAKNKRDWSQINARKGKRYVEREQKPVRTVRDEKPERRQIEKGAERAFDEAPAANVIIGRNPLMEALKNDREIEKILVGKGAEGSVTKIVAMAKDKGIPLYQSDKQTLDRIACGRPHQGVIAYASAYSYGSMEDIYAKANAKDEDPFVIILDNLEDPHNLGAIMRTAECAGAHGVIIPKRRSCGLTEVVAKSSAGAIEYMPCVKVSNIGQTIDQLKEEGFWIAACDMGGNTYYKQDLTGPGETPGGRPFENQKSTQSLCKSSPCRSL